MSHEKILEIVDNSVKNDAKEMHIVSAHNPNDGVEWYMGAFRKIKAKYPDLHVKAMTAAEVDFITREYGHSYDEVLRYDDRKWCRFYARWWRRDL